MSALSPDRSRHHPGLDGLRGVAVLLVVVFHSGLGWVPGGFLGVSLFFTLSGYLIVDLLVRESEHSGAPNLVAFWSRRLRRLAPASLACIATVVGFAAWLSSRVEADRIRGDAVSAVAYVANWRSILQDQSYGQLFAAPSPLQHLWSLSIEEQLYVAIPLIVAAVFALGGRRRTIGWVFAALALVSVTSSVVASSRDVVYYGTHTRAVELLAGAIVACIVGHRLDRIPHWFVGAGSLALVAIVAVSITSDLNSSWVYDGGLALFALLSVVAIVGSIVPGFLSRVLGWKPLVTTGKMSYGIYLVHWPVMVWLDAERLGFAGVGLFIVQLLTTVLIAGVSYRVLEMPVRERRLLRDHRTAIAVLVTSIIVTIGLAVTFLATIETTPNNEIEVLATIPSRNTEPTDSSDPNHSSPTDQSVAPFDGTGPLNILVVGDSTAENIARGLADVADPNVGVISAGVLGCPLLPAVRVRDRVVGEQDVTYCPENLSIIAGSAPDVDVILVVVGIANQWDYLPREGANWVKAGSAEQGAELNAFMDAVQNAVAPFAVTTLVLEAPAVRDNPDLLGDDPQAIAAWSRVMSDWENRWTNVRVVPYADLLSDPYSDVGRAERPDGVHLDRSFAENMVRDGLLPRIREAWAAVAERISSP